MRVPGIPAPRRVPLIVVAAFGLALTMPALGQDRMVLGPQQFKADTTSAGAVLCAWSIYLSVQAQTAACALPRRPADDAIDQAIIAMDNFIIANSSLHPTRAALDAFKRNAAASELSTLRRLQPQFCQSQDIAQFRSSSPEQIEATVKELLAVPREPVMNPCL